MNTFATSHHIISSLHYLLISLRLGSTKAMAKLVIVLVIALLAISMAGSSHKVLAKATEGSSEQYMQALNGQGSLRIYRKFSSYKSSLRNVSSVILVASATKEAG
ncbi:hypothetical protein ZIOFF_052632 [Zingiber officinale]|uniref:Uncharacterized protein n=1 Tax=Zingiber officinale TaxID=94328 RepID=A0A8J5FP20_ZINOF|nr:hypothetical protein ZIOFF_052632 [Zingiber officinale]